MSFHHYFISDLHLGHEKLALYRGFNSADEHDQHIIRHANDTVRSKDTLWVLGDVAFGKHSLKLISQLKGIKKLVLGNHDQYSVTEYL
ncbi:MAG: metallophosphoesterase, partial [bacterium]